MTTVIKVENLSKTYQLGAAGHNSLRDAVVHFVRRPFSRGKKREIHALKDVSFEVAEGETVGIIGNNGAGKSTLLKILSRITKPTAGEVELRGRVGSLLEVGTGFHNELTGRENIYLNGAILGMKRAEIESKFDEIVAFSEIEKFLDTPVKHYSTGMYMRLAFSVAAHLEPEILIVDEVLAVGDMAFQRKCLRKMREVGETGRTVLFVSHDMQAIGRLCSRVIWLASGEVMADGETNDVISKYRHLQTQAVSERAWEEEGSRPGNEYARLIKVRICDGSGASAAAVDIRNSVFVEMAYEVLQDEKVIVPNIHIYNEFGVCVFVSHDWDSEWRTKPRKPGKYLSRMEIPGNFLAEGNFLATVAASTYLPMDVHFAERDVVSFSVVDSTEGDTARGDYAGVLPGIVRPVLNWKTEYSEF